MARHNTHAGTRRVWAIGLISALAVAAPGLAGATPAPSALKSETSPADYPLGLNEISVEDPYLLADRESDTYFLYDIDTSSTPATTVLVRSSTDLTNWSAAEDAYTLSGATNAWFIADPDADPATTGSITASPSVVSAPSVKKIDGTYYMSLTLADPASQLQAKDRGTSGRLRYFKTYPMANVVLSATSPEGPFTPLDVTKVSTNLALMLRDGSFYTDPDGTVFHVYATEWRQKLDGAIGAVQLSSTDMTQAVGDHPLYLFKASDALYLKEKNFGSEDPNFNAASTAMNAPYQVESPHLVDTPDGQLVAIYSTIREGKLAELQAVSPTGNIGGPWIQKPQVLPRDRGKAVPFTDFEGNDLLFAVADSVGTKHVEIFKTKFGEDGALQATEHLSAVDGASPVSLADTVAPVIYVPSTRVVETVASPAQVQFKATAIDAVDGEVKVTYSRQPGSYFPNGTSTAGVTTPVTVTAKDSSGNVATATFNVVVRQPRAAQAPPVAPSTADLATTFPCTMPNMGLHDPFIVADKASQRYFLYTSNSSGGACGTGVSASGTMAYQSEDLIHWSKPTVVYRVPSTGTRWNANTGPWAPEVHAYRGKYYLITTLHNNSVVTQPVNMDDDFERYVQSTMRASIIAVSDTATGPFVDLSPESPVTPREFMTLDGSLYVDPSGQPYLVYAHEWWQKQDGTIEAIPLTDDLVAAEGDPFLMWRASEIPFWADPFYGGRFSPLENKALSKAQMPGYVTDGAQVVTTPNGSLLSMWTTYRDARYIVGQAISRTGSMHGPWEQLPELDYADSGHSMVFTDFTGQLLMVQHNHMSEGTVRGEIFNISITNDGFVLGAHRQDLDGIVGRDTNDYLAPKVYPPSTRVVTLPQGANRVRVDFTAMARDNSEGLIPVTYSIQPRSFFSVGTKQVTVTARDKAGNVGTATFSVVVKPAPHVAPVVTSQPTSVTKSLGSSVVLTAAASGYPEPTVSWQRRAPGSTIWTAVAGTTTSLSVAVTAANDGAAYRAVFTNAKGDVTSAEAVVKVTRVAPKITTQPKTVSGALASTVKFSVKASGYPAPTVTWQRKLAGSSKWTTVSGAKSTTLKVTVTAGKKGAQYRAVLKNAVGAKTSKAATVKVKAAKPKIVKQPVSVTVKSGKTATFRVTAAASPKATYQWWVKAPGSRTWVRAIGGHAATLKVSSWPARNGLQAKVVVRNAKGSVTSKVVTLRVTR